MQKITEKNANQLSVGSMTSRIYEQLRSDILDGTLQPGATLSQPALAKAAGSSRGPVREALRRLQQEQLVIARDNQQFNVAPYDISDLEAVLCLQLANVALAIRVSVPLLTDQEIEHLGSCVESMERAVTEGPLGWEAPYRDFTLTIIKHSSPRIETLISLLIDNIQRHRRKTLDKIPSVYSGGPEFRAIFAAVEARNGKLSAERYAKFMSRLSTLILGSAAPQYDAFRLRGYVLAMGSYDEF